MTTTVATMCGWCGKANTDHVCVERRTVRLLCAKYTSKCLRCRTNVAGGARVYWMASVGTIHAAACVPVVTAPTAAKAIAPAAKPAAQSIAACVQYTEDQGCPLHGETCRR